MKRGILLVIVVLPLVALFSFGLTRDPQLLPSALIGKEAPPFALASLEGGTTTLERLKGKPVVINFWSTWCSSCVAEHLLLKQAFDRDRHDVTFLAILYEDSAENVRRFTKRFGPGVPVLLDPDLRTAIDYGVAGVPETFFLDRNGIVVSKHTGTLTAEALMKNLKRAVTK